MVLFVTPIFAANSSEVYSESSISKETTFFSVLFKPTFKPTFLRKKEIHEGTPFNTNQIGPTMYIQLALSYQGNLCFLYVRKKQREKTQNCIFEIMYIDCPKYLC